MRRTQLDLDSFEDGRKGPWIQEFSRSLEAGKEEGNGFFYRNYLFTG